MANLEVGPIYAEIGQLVARDVGAEPDGTFLHAEVEPGAIACAIFKDLGEKVIFRYCSTDLVNKIYEAWKMEAADKKWLDCFYTIKGGKFEVKFSYADDYVADDTYEERRERAIIEKFGDKPVEYPGF